MDDTGPSDEELLARLRAGDTDAWGEVYSAYRVMLHRVARRTLDVREGGTLLGLGPEDVVLECFTEVMERGVGEVRRTLRAYLRRAVYNKAVDVVRAKVRQRRYEGAIVQSGVEESAEERATLALRGEEIREHLGILTEQQRRALTERVMRNRSATEVAKEMGISDSAVAGLVRRAMKHIAPLLSEHVEPTNEVTEEEGGVG
jgi:RNA polymerase sigma factor (sigma-70 family)